MRGLRKDSQESWTPETAHEVSQSDDSGRLLVLRHVSEVRQPIACLIETVETYETLSSDFQEV